MDTISAVEGTILDDDTVVKALEDLKGEAGDVAREVRRNAYSSCWFRVRQGTFSYMTFQSKGERSSSANRALWRRFHPFRPVLYLCRHPVVPEP